MLLLKLRLVERKESGEDGNSLGHARCLKAQIFVSPRRSVAVKLWHVLESPGELINTK